MNVVNMNFKMFEIHISSDPNHPHISSSIHHSATQTTLISARPPLHLLPVLSIDHLSSHLQQARSGCYSLLYTRAADPQQFSLNMKWELCGKDPVLTWSLGSCGVNVGKSRVRWWQQWEDASWEFDNGVVLTLGGKTVDGFDGCNRYVLHIAIFRN